MGRLKEVTAIEQNDVLVDVDLNVTGNQPGVTTYDYELNGSLDSTSYGNGLVHDYTYDNLNRLVELNHFVDTDSDGVMDEGEQRATFDYTLRADGKRSSVVEKFWHDAGGDLQLPDEQNTFDWSYDEVGRLIGEVLDSTDDTIGYSDAFVLGSSGQSHIDNS